MTDRALKLGVLSRRAPIGHTADLTATLEHVGGLTRVLPALAEFANLDWTALTTQSQAGLPRYYSFSEISNQIQNNNINIFLTEVDNKELAMSDWFCTHYIWPLLHDVSIPELDNEVLEQHFNAIVSTSRAMAVECFDIDNDGYFVNDFQLSQVPATLRELEPTKPITFFLHTPWPKLIPSDSNAIKILEFLASGMLFADVIQFQTQADLQGFEQFVIAHMSLEMADVKLEVNPVSVDVHALQEQALSVKGAAALSENEVSYVHIARSDPVKKTLAAIKAFTSLAEQLKDSQSRMFLDLFVVPSRQQWPEYQVLLSDIMKCTKESNSRLSSLGYDPIRLQIGNDYQRVSQALTRYDFLIACSVADGLNLVIKEGAILNTLDGVVVSAPNVGAMAELGHNCVVAESASEAAVFEALLAATRLSVETRKIMAANLKSQIQEFDASYWAQSVIANFRILEKV